MAKRIRSLNPKLLRMKRLACLKALTVDASKECSCPEAEDGEHECAVLEAQEKLEAYRRMNSFTN